MNRGKLIAACMLVIVLLIVIAQNVQPVETQFLFWTLTMPQTLLLFFTGTLGFALGVLVAYLLSRRTKKKL